MSRRQWIVTQIGAREHYGVAVALHREAKLRGLYTDIWWSHAAVVPWLPKQFRALSARRHPELPPMSVRAFTRAALWREITRRAARSRRNPYDEFIAIGQWFGTRVRDDLRQQPMDFEKNVFFGYDTGCLETLELTHAVGISGVVDQIDAARIGEDIMNEERQRWPGWERAPAAVPEAYWERLAAEWSLADVVAVNSRWTQTALEKQGVPAAKIHIVPLAFETRQARAPKVLTASTSRPFTVLWVGNVSLRKGIPYLFAAARKLMGAHVEFVVAGEILISGSALASAPSNVRFLGRIPRSELTPVYSNADLFVFPTLSDGFGLTQLEAMAHGLPVIATPNCGDVVSEGNDGFIVPIRDPERLAEAIDTIIADRQLQQQMSEAAVQKSKTFSLTRIAHELAVLDERLLAGRSAAASTAGVRYAESGTGAFRSSGPAHE